MRAWFITSLVLAVACASDTRPRLYASSDLPPDGALTTVPPALYDSTPDGQTTVAIAADGIRSLQFLGASIVQDTAGEMKGVNFAIYSQRAEKVQLLLFDDPEAEQPTRTFEMSREGDVWNVYVE